jgi:tetratricopeptide (TPR) repeat protein
MAYINQALPYLEKASAHYRAAGQRPSDVPGGNAPAQQAQDSPGERKHPSEFTREEREGSRYTQFEQMKAHISRGVFLYMQNCWDESIEAFEDALALGAEELETGGSLASPPAVGLLRARAYAHFQIALVNNMTARPLSGLEHATRSLAAYTSVKRPYGQATAYSVLALANYLLDNYRQGCLESQRGIELAGQAQGWRMLGYLHTIHALNSLPLGKIGESLLHAQEAIRLGEEHHHGDIAALGYLRMGDIFTLLGEGGEAFAYYQRGLEIDRKGYWGVDGLMRSGHVLCLAGQREEAWKWLSQALDQSQEYGLETVYMLGQYSLACLHFVAGDRELAKHQASALAEEANRRSLRALSLGARLVQGAATFEGGDYQGAQQHFIAIAEEAEKLSQPWIQLQAHIRLAQGLDRLGLPVQAHRERIQALLKGLEASLPASDSEYAAAITRAFHSLREKIFVNL